MRKFNVCGVIKSLMECEETARYECAKAIREGLRVYGAQDVRRTDNPGEERGARIVSISDGKPEYVYIHAICIDPDTATVMINATWWDDDEPSWMSLDHFGGITLAKIAPYIRWKVD